MVTNIAKAKKIPVSEVTQSNFGKIFGLNIDAVRRNERISKAVKAFSKDGEYVKNIAKVNDVIRSRWETFVQRNAFSVKYDSSVDDSFLFFTLEALKKFGYDIDDALSVYTKLTKYE